MPSISSGSRDLLLLRNGKAFSDRPRPLKDSGKRQVQRIGVWMAAQGLLPDYVVAQPSERAVVSAQKALKAGGLGARDLRKMAQLSSAALRDQLGVLRGLPAEAHRPMLVAHRKNVERLARHLTGKPDISIGTGTLLHLSMPADWSDLPTGCADLRALIRPEELPERFPFPGPGGAEWRDRPAYYYRQSAVIPWRLGSDGLQILVITSSKRNHWVVPKGIHDPGYSAQESAAREAEEEAGVLGVVGDAPLGAFALEKWGATCRVEVYPMRVTRTLDEAQWDESHRHRRWVAPAEAVAHLKHEGLGRIVTEFSRTLPQ